MQIAGKTRAVALLAACSFVWAASPKAIGGTVSSGFENKNTSVGQTFNVGPVTDRAVFSGDAFAGSLGISSLYFDGLRSWMVVGGGTGFIDFNQIASDVSFWARTRNTSAANTDIRVFDTLDQEIASAVVLSSVGAFRKFTFTGSISRIEVLNNDPTRMNAVDRITFTTAPEPSTFVLGLLGLVALLGSRYVSRRPSQMRYCTTRGERCSVSFHGRETARSSAGGTRMVKIARTTCAAIVASCFTVAQAVELTDPIPAPITKGSIEIGLHTVADGLVAPNYLTHAGDGTNRLFVVDQIGTIRVVENGNLLPTPFLDISFANPDPIAGRLVEPRPGFDERGLLGMAFHPDFGNEAAAGFGKVYTYSSEEVSTSVSSDFTVTLPAGSEFDHQSVITEWMVDALDGNVIDQSSRRELMRIDEPQFNHDAGMIDFGPDGDLYISLGDGGSANDDAPGHGVDGNGQDKTNVLGTILRIDVDTSNSANGQYGVPSDNPFVLDPTGVDEIFAYGLRNPFRFSFDVDPATGQVTPEAQGDLIVADVGQGDIEEVDIVTSGGNFGWRQKEGSFAFDPAGFVTDDVVIGDFIDPVIEYDHDEGISVIGGFVYRNSAIVGLDGKYVFGDFSQGFDAPGGRLFFGDLSTGDINEFVIGNNDRDLGLFIKGFGQDAAGDIYLLASTALAPEGTTGVVLKFVPLPEPSTLVLMVVGLFAVGLARRRHMRRA